MQTPPLIPAESNPQFAQFWQVYPKKESKVTAEKAFGIAICKTDLPTLLKALEAVKLTEQWKRGVIPLAASWLNQRRWEDTLTSTNPKPGLSPIQLQIHSGEYQRILEAMRIISTAYGDHQNWTKDDKNEYRKLKARRNELRTMLGIML